MAADANGSPPVILELAGLCKSFGDLPVLRGVSLTVRKGEVISIIGASGSGKSTLLRCINQLERPQAGSMTFSGDLFDYGTMHFGWRSRRRIRDLRTRIGMVFQSFNLWPHKTVLENVIEAPVHVRGRAVGEATERAMALLEQIGLAEKRDEHPRTLSGGQQQRVAIVRALAMDPQIMLFDEVTSALDPELVGEVLDLMQKLAEDGMTMLIVTHEMGFARHVSQRTAFFHAGEIAEIGPSTEVLGAPSNEHTKRFLSRVLRHS